MCRGLFSEDNPEVILVIDHFERSLTGRCGEQCRIQILRQGGGGGGGGGHQNPEERGGGGGGGGRAGHQDPEIRRGRVSTKVFSALQASVWSKNKWGPSPPDPPLGRFDCVKLKLLISLTI